MRNDKSRMKHSIQIFSALGILLVVCLLGQKSLTVFADKFPITSQPVEIQTPTIMVPGTNGTVDRFDGLIKSLNTEEDVEVLKVTVASDNTVLCKGRLSASSAHPIIVIAFEDSSTDTLSVQGKWYQIALVYIQKSYSFKTYNYLGHSNGGLVITSYLENDQQVTDPELSKLITIGTPYNDLSSAYNNTATNVTQIKKTSPLLKGYLKNLDQIPSNIQMRNIAGEIKHSASDGTVPVQSVFAGRSIYQDRIADYQELLIQGEQTNHSELVENTEIIDQIKTFFWQN
jgi:uncharacterized alpha/beta hydrolase family protein